MTIASSGALELKSTINGEMNTTGSVSLLSAASRFLSNKSTGSVVFPNDFYGKLSVQVVATASLGSAQKYTFSSVNFGPEYSGRTIIVIYKYLAAGTYQLSSITIGGIAGNGANHGEFSEAGNTVACGIYSATPVGTSGDVVIQISGTANSCDIIVLSVANISTLTPYSSVSINGGGGGLTTGTVKPNIPTDGILVVAIAKYGAYECTFSAGVTKRSYVNGLTVGFDNKLASQNSRTVTGGGTGALTVIFACSYT